MSRLIGLTEDTQERVSFHLYEIEKAITKDVSDRGGMLNDAVLTMRLAANEFTTYDLDLSGFLPNDRGNVHSSKNTLPWRS